MKKYMTEHIAGLRKRLALAAQEFNWHNCIKLEARIQEAEYLYTEMLRKGLITS